MALPTHRLGRGLCSRGTIPPVLVLPLPCPEALRHKESGPW